MRYRYLSHLIEDGMPVYGARASVVTTAVKRLARKDSANVSAVSLENHWGTHVDLPRHFFDKGMAVCDYPAGFWYFAAPCVIKVSLKPSELLRCGPWCNLVRRNHDIVLFRSLWGARRARMEYMLSNPGIHQEAALFLRRRFPNIRAVGIDWISVSPYKDRSAGRLSHRAFLNPEEAGRPVAIIEDMDLSAPMRGLRSITALPVRIDGLDSAPATVIGAFDD